MSAELPPLNDKDPADSSASSIADPGIVIPLDNSWLEVEPATALPVGFSYADSMTCHELSVLNNTVEVFGVETGDDVYLQYAVRHNRSEHSIGIGVRSKADAQLVGYGLLVIQRDWTGQLYNFMVHPRARHRGIGRAIIDERITQADRLQLGSLNVSLNDSNTLRSYYLEHGFREHGHSRILRRVLGGVAQTAAEP